VAFETGQGIKDGTAWCPEHEYEDEHEYENTRMDYHQQKCLAHE
jgi:hypothetical protein